MGNEHEAHEVNNTARAITEQVVRMSPEDEIRDAVRQGDRRRGVSLAAQHWGEDVGRVCMAWTGSQSDAQELAQETFVALYSALGSFRGEGTLRAFVFGIARNLCAKHVAVGRRREARLRLVSETVPEVPSDELLAARRRAESVRRALAGLKPSERDAAVLRYVSELSHREIADACGVDEGTARKRVSRAIASLRQTLEHA